jgi:hypothetical protein
MQTWYCIAKELLFKPLASRKIVIQWTIQLWHYLSGKDWVFLLFAFCHSVRYWGYACLGRLAIHLPVDHVVGFALKQSISVANNI